MLNPVDASTIGEAIAGVAIGQPTSHGALTVVPLYSTGAIEPDWLTFAEAADVVAITEISRLGSVSSCLPSTGTLVAR